MLPPPDALLTQDLHLDVAWLLDELLHEQRPVPEGGQSLRVGPGVVLLQLLGRQAGAQETVGPELCLPPSTPPPGPSAGGRPASASAHLVAVHDPHAAAPAPVGGLEDDGEAVGVGELVGLVQGSDGGIRAGHHGHSCWQTGRSGHSLPAPPRQPLAGARQPPPSPVAMAMARASTLSPILRTTSGLGPMNRTPASWQAWAKSARSDRNP